MKKAKAAVGSLVFLLVAPGVVAGVIPWLLTGWQVRQPLPYWGPLLVLGGAVLVAGVVVLTHSFIRFALEGIGTPAPVAPTKRLVIGGLYRYVRNPMYLAVVGTIFGQALLLGQPLLILYGGAIWIIFVIFVRWYEEPTLAQHFGREYEDYKRAVPPWWPRVRQWKRDPAS